MQEQYGFYDWILVAGIYEVLSKLDRLITLRSIVDIQNEEEDYISLDGSQRTGPPARSECIDDLVSHRLVKVEDNGYMPTPLGIMVAEYSKKLAEVSMDAFLYEVTKPINEALLKIRENPNNLV